MMDIGRGILLAAALGIAIVSWSGRLGAAPFVRGDADGNGAIELTDSVLILSHLFLEPGGIECDDAADVNDSGDVDIADAVYGLNFLFLGGPPPLAPYPDCGNDPTDDDLGCDAHEPCAGEPVILQIALETSGGFTGRGATDYQFADDVLIVHRPFADPQECSMELDEASVDLLLDAAESVDWDGVLRDYRPTDNPECCCDQIVSELSGALTGGGWNLRKTTVWCDQSMSEGLLPDDLLAFVAALVDEGREVEEACPPAEE